MPDCMMPFPEDWHDFLKDYSFDDSQEVYTNGSRLIPVFRVEQLIKHLLKAQEPVKPKKNDVELAGLRTWDWACPECNCILTYRANYCSCCGRAVKWE